MSNEEKVKQMKATLDAQRKDLMLKQSLLKEKSEENLNKSETDRAILRGKEDTKAAPYWSKVKEEAQDLKTPKAQSSYMEWYTSVMEIFDHVCVLSKALIADNSAGRILDFIWNKSISAIDDIGEKINGTSIGTDLEKGLKSWIYRAKDNEIPPLKYSISVDDAGKLTTEVMKDGQPLPTEQQQLFDVGFIVWAEERGCTFDHTNQTLTDENGLIMTMDKLKELNQDDEKGLNAFFEGKFELKISPNPSPRP